MMVTADKIRTDNLNVGKDLHLEEFSDVRTLKVSEFHHEELECEQGNRNFIEVLIRKTPGKIESNNRGVNTDFNCDTKNTREDVQLSEGEYKIMNRVWIQWMKFVQQKKNYSNQTLENETHLDYAEQGTNMTTSKEEGEPRISLHDYDASSICESRQKVEALEDEMCDEDEENCANEYFFMLFEQKRANFTLRRFFRKWKNWTLQKRELEHLQAERQQREEKIRKYIELIATKQKTVSEVKSKPSPSLESSFLTDMSDFSDSGSKVSASSKSTNYGEKYKHRFQAQKSIIASQKSKIEDQNKIIEDLKSLQLRLEAEMSQRESSQNLKATLQNFDPRHKSKSAFVQRALSSDSGYRSIDHTSDNNSVEHDNSEEHTEKKSVASEMVRRMEKRNAERKLKMQAAQERRRQLEEEKLRKAIEEEEMKQRREIEAKQKKIEEIREKQRLERERAEEQIREREIFHQNCQIAEESNRRRLLTKGLRKLHYNVLTIKRDSFIADDSYKMKLKQRCFRTWRRNVKQTVAMKITKAELFYDQCLKRKAFQQIFEIYKDYIQKSQAADDMYDMKVQSKYFKRWYDISCQAYLKMQEKMKVAANFHDRRIVRSNFNQWKKLPKIMFEERGREKRLRALRERVQELIPDYCPVPFENED
nr:PREDICTED: trichohyalin [Bemisia tabaci]